MTKEEFVKLCRRQFVKRGTFNEFAELLWEDVNRERRTLQRRYQRKIKALQDDSIS
jgi:hypothetical protein